MTSSQLFRLGGLALAVGAVAFGVHLVARSVLTAGADPAVLYREGSWVLVNALGVAGAALVLLGLPAMYARMAGPAGRGGLVGVVLLALAWMFLGLFLSLYSVLVAPWVAAAAPGLVAASAPLPVGIVLAFLAALGAEAVGTVLLAMPFVRGRAQPRWVGYLLPAAALLTVAGAVIAPSGPAANLATNLLSNLGPVLLMVALGALGARTWAEPAPAGPRMFPPPV
jgi:hypothetical protein